MGSEAYVDEDATDFDGSSLSLDFVPCGSPVLRTVVSSSFEDVPEEARNMNKEEGFYDEVDQRMSRNSLEYPEQQARHLKDWLNALDSFPYDASMDFSTSPCGNIIGIRGISAGPKRTCKSQVHRNLERDYEQLKREHENLGSRFMELKRNSERRRKRNRAVLGEKESLRSRQQQDKLNLEQQISGLKRRVEDIELARMSLENENLKLRGLLESLNRPSRQERAPSGSSNGSAQFQTDTTQLGHTTKKKSGSHKLTGNQIDELEFQTLKENYLNLELELNAVMNEHQQLQEERNRETAQLMAELYRLQVLKPKLEYLLDAERSVKQEVETKLELVEVERDQLKSELGSLRASISNDKIRQSKLENIEMERLSEELDNWKEKLQRVKKEKADADNFLRSYKSKIAILESKHQSELELLREQANIEAGRSLNNYALLEDKYSSVEGANKELKKKCCAYELEKVQLNERMTSLVVQVTAKEDNLERLKAQLDEKQKLVDQLRKQLSELSSQRRVEAEDSERFKRQCEKCQQELAEARKTHELQVSAYNELKEKREKELRELRTSLNLERYNKQVAIKSIEKELKVSLNELDLMKCRLSRRMTGKDQPKLIGVNRQNHVCVASRPTF